MTETGAKQQITAESPTFAASSLWFAFLACLPVIFALISLRTDGQFAFWQLFVRQFWLPGQIFEVGTIIFAFSQGCSLQREFKSYPHFVRILTVVWFASIIVATLFSPQPNTAMLGMISWTIHALFAISIYYLWKNWENEAGLNCRYKLATWVPLGGACFGLLIVAFVLGVGLQADYDWVSSLPGFTHIRHSGYFLMPAMALSAGMIAITDGRQKLRHMALLAANFGFTIWIGSRGPLTVFVALLLLAFILFAVMRNIRTIGALLLSVAAGASLSQAIPAPAHSSFNAISRIEGGKSQSVDKLSSGRTDIWRDTAQGIAERPLVGHGGNQFRLLVPAAQKTYNHPHNSVLQFTYEWGLVGGGALLCLLALLFWRMFRISMMRPNEMLPLFLAASSMAIFSLIDGVFYYNLPIMLFLTFAFAILVQRAPEPTQ